ncbi:Alpha-mannosidase 2x [Bulinus truncatus]|nr:Alpha-mannosidase 2x [Bulinus truncatus]
MVSVGAPQLCPSSGHGGNKVLGQMDVMKVLQLIEDRMVRLEGDIELNKKVVQRIKDEVDDMIKLGPEGAGKVKSTLEEVKPQEPVQPAKPRKEEMYEVSAFPDVKLLGEQCEWVNSATSKADISMHRLHSELPFDNPDGGPWKQGWDVTYKPDQWTKDNRLKIVVVPHTHCDPGKNICLSNPHRDILYLSFTQCDPGWIKTFDDYYQTQTKSILNNFVPKLEENKNYKFMFSEISYFSQWWSEIDPGLRERVKRLIASGQFEISTGGWVMTDEADAHYYAMLDQLIEGHQWLNSSLGYVPQSGWAVDPFGYSSTMAYLLKRSQFKSMLIQRVHYSIKKYLARERNLEFMWRQQWDSTGGTDIFTHMMPFYSYDIPHTCGPEPAVCCQFDFRRLPGSPYRCPWNINPVAISPENVEQRTKVILDQWKKKATLYKTNVVLIPLGDDFRYMQSDEFDLQFGNYEKIFNYLNTHPELGAVAQFGTLSDYFNTLYAETQTSPGQKPSGISTLSGDFFSYADRDDHYWTGYFTSRPLHKSLDRVLEHNLRSAEIIFSLTQVQARKHAAANFPSRDFMQKLVDARRALGLFQHHDGITGTAKDFVMVDYAQRLLRALQNTKTIISECSTFLLAQTKTDYSYTDGNPLFNIDQLRLTHDSLPTRPVLELGSEPKPVSLYNSLGQTRTEVVQLWTSSPYVEVRDQSDTVIHSQVDPLWTEPGAFSANIFKVSFVADLPGLSIRKFTVRKVASGDDTKNHLVSITYLNADQQFDVKTEPFPINFIKNEEDFKLETKFLECSFSGTSGLLKSVKTLTNGEVYKSEIEFIQYGTTMAKEKSGAYIFLPDGEAKPLLTSKPLLIRIIKGPITSEAHVVTQYIQHIARLHNSPGTDGASVDISNIVDIRTTQNKEVGMRIHTNIENPDHVFYSDLNGFQMQKRKYYQKLTLQGNVYPMPTMAYLQDGMRRVSVLSAQSAGAANLIPDSMDVMLDRRLSQDDNRGLGQGVLDNHPTLSKFRLLFEKRSAAAQVVTPESSFPSLLGQLSSLALIHPVFVMPRNVQGKEYPLNKEMLLLTDSLPCEVHLLNLRVLQHGDDQKELQYVPKDSSLLLLRNFPHDCGFAAPHLSCLSTDGKIVLSKLFSNAEVKESVQTSLTMATQLAVIDPSSTLPVSPVEIVAVQTLMAAFNFQTLMAAAFNCQPFMAVLESKFGSLCGHTTRSITARRTAVPQLAVLQYHSPQYRNITARSNTVPQPTVQQYHSPQYHSPQYCSTTAHSTTASEPAVLQYHSPQYYSTTAHSTAVPQPTVSQPAVLQYHSPQYRNITARSTTVPQPTVQQYHSPQYRSTTASEPAVLQYHSPQYYSTTAHSTAVPQPTVSQPAVLQYHSPQYRNITARSTTVPQPTVQQYHSPQYHSPQYCSTTAHSTAVPQHLSPQYCSITAHSTATSQPAVLKYHSPQCSSTIAHSTIPFTTGKKRLLLKRKMKFCKNFSIHNISFCQ